MKVFPVPRFDGLARILTKVEEIGVWPEASWMLIFSMIPKVDGDVTPLGQRALCVHPAVYRIWASACMMHLEDWFKSWVPESVYSAGGGRSSVDAWYTTAFDIEESLSLAQWILTSMCLLRMYFNLLILLIEGLSIGFLVVWDNMFGFGMTIWSIMLMLGFGLSMLWDGCIPQGGPLNMMFTVALYLLWCWYLEAQCGVMPQVYADNLKSVFSVPDVFLHAARIASGCVRLFGQELALSKCVLMSTSTMVRKDIVIGYCLMRGDKWSVKLDVPDPGGHLDTTFRCWSATLAAIVRLVISRLWLAAVLPLDLHGDLG